MTETKTRLHGYDAIDYAEEHGLLLCTYADPTEGAREGLSPDEARSIAAEDPSLVYLDIQQQQQIRALLDDVLALFEEARGLMPLDGTKKRAEWVTRAAAAAERLRALLS